MKYILLLIILFIPSYTFGATCTINHEHTIAGHLAEVVQICRDNRIKLLEASGLRVLNKLDNDKYECLITINKFIIKETRLEEFNKLTIKWELVEGTDRLTHYESITIFEGIDDKTTKITGKLSVTIGEGNLGSRILEREIRDGITKMIDKMEDLLHGTNQSYRRRTVFRFTGEAKRD